MAEDDYAVKLLKVVAPYVENWSANLLAAIAKMDWEEAALRWLPDPPKNDGDFYFSGITPSGMDVVAIVQIFSHPTNGRRGAVMFIPPGWRGDNARVMAEVIQGSLEEWRGQWAGPEFGLNCVVNQQKGD